jgi:hypothetical protein
MRNSNGYPDSSGNDTARHWIEANLGLGPEEADAFINDLDQKLRPLAQSFAALVAPLSDWLARLASQFEQFVRQIEAAPEIEGHEKLLITSVGHHPMLARCVANLIRRWGTLFAAETNDGRRASAIMHWIAKRPDASSLVISRRAKLLLNLWRGGHAEVAIDRAIKKYAGRITLSEFENMVVRACERDQEACHSLSAMCKSLIASLPDPRGRPISEATGIHIFLRRYLASHGIGGAYTYSENDDKDDFVDKGTQATRLAVHHPRFSPLHARDLMKGDTLPPIVHIDSTGSKRMRSGPRLSTSRRDKRAP